jgi:tripartite-type tricarboxylate transporter receptor subunit TctC
MPLISFGADPWPNNTIRIVVPAPAGGGVDVFTRVVAEQLAIALKQNVIVDNKAGASGLIGTMAAAQSKADGYTIAYIHSGLVTLQAMNPKLDLLKDFKPVAKLSSSPYAVVVSEDSKYKTIQELIAAVQANPGKLSYGSGGNGSPAHMAVEYLDERLKNFKGLHVPFKGALESANAIIGGQVDFQIGLLGSMVGLLKGSKLRVLAVTSRDRLSSLPNVPTLSESAVPGFVFEPWGGLAVPTGTPDAVVARLQEVLPGLMTSSAIKSIVAQQGSNVDYASSQSLSTLIAQEVELNKAVVKRLSL